MAQFKDKFNRPQVEKPDFAAIPQELVDLPQWVLWRFDWKDDTASWAKVPYQPSGRHASSSESSTWSEFTVCLRAFESKLHSFDGIGFMFSKESPYMGVDLDYCVTHDEENAEYRLTSFAARVIEKLSSYAEFSPSKTGIHIIGKAGEIKGMKVKYNDNEIEMYSWGRYFTFTGLSWHETPLQLRDFDKEIGEIRAVVAKPQDNGRVETNGQLDLDKRLKMALTSSPKIEMLFTGDISAYGGDDSRADLALCSMLARYSDGNDIVLDEMFRKSRLYRGKWDELRGEKTYGQMTIEKALSGKDSFISAKSAVLTPSISTHESRKRRRYTVDDLWDAAMEYRRNPLNGGVEPGWSNLNELYRPRKGLFTIVTGEPGSGKSTFVDCLCYNLAGMHDWRITFASFETQPLERHLLDLCQIYLGKPTFAFMPEAASDADMLEAKKVIREHFYFIFPDDHEMNMSSILEYVDDDIRDYGISGFVLDPFSELEGQTDFREQQTSFIEKNLRNLRAFTRRRDIHTWLIAHPTKSGETYKDGRPTLRSISGSSHFNNKADYGVVVHRNDDDTTTVHIDKVRFSETGMGKSKADFSYNSHARAYVPYERGI